MNSLDRYDDAIFAWQYDVSEGTGSNHGDLEFYLDALGETRGDVLELGCGTGRISLPLAVRHERVTTASEPRPVQCPPPEQPQQLVAAQEPQPSEPARFFEPPSEPEERPTKTEISLRVSAERHSGHPGKTELALIGTRSSNRWSQALQLYS